MLSQIINSLFAKITGFDSYVNGKYTEIYFNEVSVDIRLMREGMNICKFERDREFVFQYLIEKYQEKYCPSTFYPLFSRETKERYRLLREEIDKIISRKDEFFSDFLGEIID